MQILARGYCLHVFLVVYVTLSLESPTGAMVTNEVLPGSHTMFNGVGALRCLRGDIQEAVKVEMHTRNGIQPEGPTQQQCLIAEMLILLVTLVCSTVGPNLPVGNPPPPYTDGSN